MVTLTYGKDNQVKLLHQFLRATKTCITLLCLGQQIIKSIYGLK